MGTFHSLEELTRERRNSKRRKGTGIKNGVCVGGVGSMGLLTLAVDDIISSASTGNKVTGRTLAQKENTLVSTQQPQNVDECSYLHGRTLVHTMPFWACCCVSKGFSKKARTLRGAPRTPF